MKEKLTDLWVGNKTDSDHHLVIAEIKGRKGEYRRQTKRKKAEKKWDWSVERRERVGWWDLGKDKSDDQEI